MNDFQMTHLANDRIKTFHAEAQRERLARAARSARPHERHAGERSPRRRGLSLLFGRSAA